MTKVMPCYKAFQDRVFQQPVKPCPFQSTGGYINSETAIELETPACDLVTDSGDACHSTRFNCLSCWNRRLLFALRQNAA